LKGMELISIILLFLQKAYAITFVACQRGFIRDDEGTCRPDPDFIPENFLIEAWFNFISNIGITGAITLGVIMLVIIIGIPVSIVILTRKRRKR